MADSEQNPPSISTALTIQLTLYDKIL